MKIKDILACMALVIFLGLLSVEANAATEGVYTYTVSQGKATITETSSTISGNITIPATLGGYPVTSIGDLAFYWKSDLVSVTIPAGVTNIGENAFAKCDKLASVTIPNSVKDIGESAFYLCTNLKKITIPDSVVNLGTGAFLQCTNLKTAILGKRVSAIGYGTFAHCPNLSEIIIPDSVTYIGENAFVDCSNLQKVTIGDNVSKIEQCAFFGCNNLNTITLGKNITNIERDAFCGCNNLRNVLYKGSKSDWNKIHIGDSNPALLNATIQYNYIPPCTKHTYGGWVKVNDTTHRRKCSVCTYEETSNHTWDDGTVTQKADCAQAGIISYICTGCNASRTEDVPKLTTHTYDSIWHKDGTSHWHECLVCKVKEDWDTHKPGAPATENSAQKCTVCGYIIQAALGHKHTYTENWVSDDTGHWYSCSGCEEKNRYAHHNFENNCDTDCSICGYTRRTTHNYKEEWIKNEKEHWHECTICKTKSDPIAHIPGEKPTESKAQLCTICGYIIQPALNHQHSYAESWVTDENGHWHACSGCNSKEGETAHSPGSAATETTSQVCTVCGYIIAPAIGEAETTPNETGTQTNESENFTQEATDNTYIEKPLEHNRITWVIIGVAATLLLGGGAIAFFIIKKKKI